MISRTCKRRARQDDSVRQEQHDEQLASTSIKPDETIIESHTSDEVSELEDGEATQPQPFVEHEHDDEQDENAEHGANSDDEKGDADGSFDESAT